VEREISIQLLSSNTFDMEWPPKGGKLQAFLEVDRADWFDLEAARSKILSWQIDAIDRLEDAIDRLEKVTTGHT
jgi:predicted NUDIX family NTP pyrophosphohydrolase